MLNDKIYFNLEELDFDKFKKIDFNISVGGSNKLINIIVWYFNFLKVKNKFNLDVICLLIVLDSFVNVEFDRDSKYILLKYIFEELDKDS